MWWRRAAGQTAGLLLHRSCRTGASLFRWMKDIG